MKKLITCICFLFFLAMNNSSADEGPTFLNIGIKLGYTLGNNGGFTYGFEVSYTKFYTPCIVGTVFDIDFLEKMTKYHLGLEATSIITAGLCIGPTLIVEEGTKDIGLSIIPYGGILLYPYFNYTIRFSKPSLFEVGTYIKLSAPLSGDARLWED